ncbi:MAG: hypothetical protein ABSD56_00315 [Bryobacteraceae bacterium]
MRHASELRLDGRAVLRVRGTVRVITDAAGKPLKLVGTEPAVAEIGVRWPSGRRSSFRVPPDTAIPIA